MKLCSLRYVAGAMLACLLCSETSAQDAGTVTPVRPHLTLTSPAPNGFNPIAISTSEARKEATDNAAKSGLSVAYFTKQELLDLLADSKAVGIRFYNAMENSASGGAEMVAVAVKSNGTEINPVLSKSCVLSQPLSTGIIVKVVSRSAAKTYVQNTYNRSELTTFTAFFPRATIEKTLARVGAVGLKLMPASRRFEHKLADGTIEVSTFNTMTMLSVVKVNEAVVDGSGSFLKSVEPCPYLCPDDKYLLMPARY